MTFAATRHVLWALNNQQCVCDRGSARSQTHCWCI